MSEKNRKTICRNRKISFDFFVEETIEAGISLQGSEVKSLRNGTASIQDAYVTFSSDQKQAQLLNANIKEFGNKNPFFTHKATRTRTLLLKKKQITKLIYQSKAEGFTIKPIEMYFKGHLVKILIGLCKGKKNYDKRNAQKERDTKKKLIQTVQRFNTDR